MPDEAAIVWHQPLTRDGLKDIFGKAVSRDLIGRLRAPGPDRRRAPQPAGRGAHTCVTTQKFLLAFGLQDLRDLPDRGALQDAGLAE